MSAPGRTAGVGSNRAAARTDRRAVTRPRGLPPAGVAASSTLAAFPGRLQLGADFLRDVVRDEPHHHGEQELRPTLSETPASSNRESQAIPGPMTGDENGDDLSGTRGPGPISGCTTVTV